MGPSAQDLQTNSTQGASESTNCRPGYGWLKEMRRLLKRQDKPLAYAFHPVEALLEAGILPVLLIFIPLHPISFFAFITLMLLFKVYGHLGYELFSKKTYEHPIGRWLNSSVHHNLHHEKFNGNFGLYFTIWDRLCGTLREDSLEKIEEVHSRERGER